MHYKTFFKIGSWALIATAGIHSLSLISDPVPSNDTERQLIDLLNTYVMDMGAGIRRTMNNLVTFFSLSMSVLTLAIGVYNLLLVRFFEQPGLARRATTFNALLWTIYLIPLYRLTFLPPELCYSTAALAFVASWWLCRKQTGA